MMDEFDFAEDEDFDNLLPDSFYAPTSEQKPIGDEEEDVEVRDMRQLISRLAEFRTGLLEGGNANYANEMRCSIADAELACNIRAEFGAFVRDTHHNGWTDLGITGNAEIRDPRIRIIVPTKYPAYVKQFASTYSSELRKGYVPWRQAQLIMCLQKKFKHPWFDPNLLQLVWPYI
jgi:hypothetical protein